jgi:hypothetical protein
LRLADGIIVLPPLNCLSQIENRDGEHIQELTGLINRSRQNTRRRHAEQENHQDEFGSPLNQGFHRQAQSDDEGAAVDPDEMIDVRIEEILEYLETEMGSGVGRKNPDLSLHCIRDPKFEQHARDKSRAEQSPTPTPTQGGEEKQERGHGDRFFESRAQHDDRQHWQIVFSLPEQV